MAISNAGQIGSTRDHRKVMPVLVILLFLDISNQFASGMELGPRWPLLSPNTVLLFAHKNVDPCEQQLIDF
jgi:hypothetical protein